LVPQPASTDKALELAVQHLQNGQFEEARVVCEQILKKDARDVNALHLMGLACANSGDLQKAVDLFKRALKIQPDSFEIHNNLGNILQAFGDNEGAYQSFLQASKLNATNFGVFYNMGNALTSLGRFAGAINAYQQAAKLETTNADIHVNLGLAHKATGDLEAAISSFQDALTIDGSHVNAAVSLGNVLMENDQLAEAVAIFRVVASVNPQLFAVFNNLGVAETKQGLYQDSKKSLEKALELDSSAAEVYNNLGVVERLLGNYEAAIARFQSAIQRRPTFAEPYRNIGQTLAETGKPAESIEFFQKALTLEPDFLEARFELGVAYATTGDSEKSAAIFADLNQASSATAILATWGECMAILPQVYETENQIGDVRQKFDQSLSKLEELIDRSTANELSDAEVAVGTLQPFFLTYQGKNDVELLKRYGRLTCKVVQARFPAYAERPPMPLLKDGEALRLGVVSRHFNNHSDWRVLIRGIVETFDRHKISIHGYSTGGTKDAVTKELRSQMQTLVEGLGGESLYKKISDDKLHILLFPEIGMDPYTLKTAALRLAPIQCVSWARPETSGLPSIDYFLGSELMEPSDGQEHYSEQLVRLKHLCAYYVPPALEPDISGLNKLGLRPNTVRYLCVQSLFKYLPQHDKIFAEIAAKVPEAEFIFVAKPPDIAHAVVERIKKCFKERGLDADRHITLLPMLSHAQFAGLLKSSHVFLDSVDYTGCLTTLDALEQDLPVVTIRGALMRGRQSAAMLELIDLNELVAENIEQVVEIAVRIGTDKAARDAVLTKIQSRRYWLYRDSEAMESLQNWLLDTVKAQSLLH
jgi:protein O-GlcNAc transferase